ncbi:hypothetical protein B0J11DRAFT_513605 [Dendryphion nanum]|uniref:NAD-dependent epimerase/dehydratase domain-containing protein n=1 Tax=Dendryphion nanum TaxID=256645 RepID=A0A9P9J1M8_9PLEO|nr:hypothetical protein B0J11DRAFT_513605 [Dendryphion nanum]
MSKGLVLISGVNGYIAARTAAHFLDSGYSVRGTVRKASSAQALIDGPLSKYAKDGTFTIAEVPDITVPGAFDTAVKGVTAIAHLAAPVSFGFTDPVPILHAAVNGTKTILESALQFAGPQLKTVVIMSSIAAVLNGSPPPYKLSEKDWNNFAEGMVEAQGKETPGPIIYVASKAAAEKAFWAFRDEKKPSWSMTAVNPVFVIGPPLLAPKTEKDVGETYAAIWQIFKGEAFPEPSAGLPHVVDVRDVAKLTLYPIEHPAETNGERYIASAAVGHPQAVADILRNEFPEAKDRIREGTPGQGYKKGFEADETLVNPVDGGKGEKALGGYIKYEKSVVDTAKALKALL